MQKVVKCNWDKKEEDGKKTTTCRRVHGSLKISTVDKLAKDYQNAVQNNLGSVEKIRTATGIYTTLYHYSSTDEKLMHLKCPKGNTSWWFYQCAIVKKEMPNKHNDIIKTPVLEKFISKICPCTQRIPSMFLSVKWIVGNEALHTVIWLKCNNDIFVKLHSLRVLVALVLVNSLLE